MTRVTELVHTRPFQGWEAEGPHRGARVLFVPGCCCPAEVRRAAGRSDAVRAYYGAGNNRLLREDTLAELRRLFPDHCLDVEVVEVVGPVEVLVGTRATIISLTPDQRARYWKRVEGGEIIWEGLGEAYHTRVDDPLFDQDREV